LLAVLARPAALHVPVAPDDGDRLGDALVGSIARVAQVVEPAQDVVEVPVRERELEPARIDQLAGRLPPEQPPLEHVFIATPAGLSHLGRAAGSPLVLEQPLDDVDRRSEGRHRGAVLDLAVPPAVRELLTEEPIAERCHVDPEIGAGRDDVAVDARLNLTLEEPVVRPRTLEIRDSPGDVLADEPDRAPGLRAPGIEP